jgi:hypothetical protein
MRPTVGFVRPTISFYSNGKKIECLIPVEKNSAKLTQKPLQKVLTKYSV